MHILFFSILLAAQAAAAKKELTEEEAKKIASQEFAGKILEVEKEKHKGELVYSVEIQGTDGVHEIIIHAATGKILENKAKGAHDDDDDDDD